MDMVFELLLAKSNLFCGLLKIHKSLTYLSYMCLKIAKHSVDLL